MIKNITLKKIIEITNAKALHIADGSLSITQISIDSRQMPEKALFIAIKGDRFDGHDYIEQAILNGACAALVEKDNGMALPMLLVPDAKKAMAQLAHFLRQSSKARFIALTGSSGKTSVKEMTATILQQKGKTLYTYENLNNEIGVPLTLFRLQVEDEFAVIELGANHGGEIAQTTHLVEPDIALINNVSPAHLEGFGSLEGVFAAKGEIFEGLAEKGIGLVNLDCCDLDWKTRYFTGTYRTWLTFSAHDKAADYFAHAIKWEEKTHFQLTTPKGEIALELPLIGPHNVGNAVAAAALAQLAGASFNEIQRGISQLKPVLGRLYPIQLTPKVLLIDDTYNANIGSMKAAIETLAQQKGHRILVAGDMGELGETAAALHREVGEYAKQSGIETVLTFGKLSASLSKGFGKGLHFKDQSALITAIKQAILQDSCVTILIKGSRSAKMETIVHALQTKE